MNFLDVFGTADSPCWGLIYIAGFVFMTVISIEVPVFYALFKRLWGESLWLQLGIALSMGGIFTLDVTYRVDPLLTPFQAGITALTIYGLWEYRKRIKQVGIWIAIHVICVLILILALSVKLGFLVYDRINTFKMPEWRRPQTVWGFFPHISALRPKRVNAPMLDLQPEKEERITKIPKEWDPQVFGLVSVVASFILAWQAIKLIRRKLTI